MAEQRRLDGLLRGSTGLLALALYAFYVSRGEVLPYSGLPRTLTGVALAGMLVVLLGWRLRGLPVQSLGRGLVREVAPITIILVVGLLLRVGLGGLWRIAEPDEVLVLTVARQIIADEPLAPGDGLTMALGWLQAVVAAGRYMAGISGGLWRAMDGMTIDQLLPWSRGLHLVLSLLTIGAVYLASRPLGQGPALLAAGLLTISTTGIAAGARVDTAALLGLLGALVALVAAPRLVPRLAAAVGEWSRPVRLLLALGAIAIIWLPGVVVAALAPFAAIVPAILLRRWWTVAPPRTVPPGETGPVC